MYAYIYGILGTYNVTLHVNPVSFLTGALRSAT